MLMSLQHTPYFFITMAANTSPNSRVYVCDWPIRDLSPVVQPEDLHPVPRLIELVERRCGKANVLGPFTPRRDKANDLGKAMPLTRLWGWVSQRASGFSVSLPNAAM